MDRNFLLGALVAALVSSAGLLPAAAAQTGTLLGTFKSWSAYSADAGGKQVCYALSAPRASEPKAKRGPIYFLVNDWPERHAKAEAEVVAGYPYKDNSPVSVEIGADKFAFFARDNGDDGDAWIKSLGDEQHLMDMMQKGGSAVVTGVSKRGTVTRDTYTLDGFADALAKIHAACKM